MAAAADAALPLDLLACPSCRGPLELKASVLRCASCGLDYPVKDGIADFLPDSGPL